MKRRVLVVLLACAGRWSCWSLPRSWPSSGLGSHLRCAISADCRFRAPDVLERGRYLVYGPAACAYCHVVREQWPALARGEMLPLTGAHVFPLPFGRIYSANITPDPETGIGRRTDGELARILRYGVRADGHVAVPLMEYQDMADEDLVAVISFLRSRPAVRQARAGARA